MSKRREFTRSQREDIVHRATDAVGVVRCEGCGLALKKGAWEIDHRIPEALHPAADKTAKLTLADGQLLGFCCHRGPDGKTNADVKQIAKAKRQSVADKGIKAPKQKIPGRGFPAPDKLARAGKTPLPPRMMFVPRGGVYPKPEWREHDDRSE